VIAVAGGILLAIVALALVARVVSALANADNDRAMDGPSERQLARRKRIAEELAKGPCYVDSRGRVRQGLRKWKW